MAFAITSTPKMLKQWMDPFSIVVGSVGFLDVCVRVISVIRDVYNGADRVEEAIAALKAEIDALLSVHHSLNNFWDANCKAAHAPLEAKSHQARVDGLWKEVATNLRDCEATIVNLEGLLNRIIDRIRKHLRKRSRDSDFLRLRQRLANVQGSLQMLLTALNLWVGAF